MRAKKAKALRQMVGYHPDLHRPTLAGGQWRGHLGTCRLGKDHPRRAYQFAKKRYGILPLASALNRLRTGL